MTKKSLVKMTPGGGLGGGVGGNCAGGGGGGGGAGGLSFQLF